MRRAAGSAILACILVAVQCGQVRADGGALRVSTEKGSYRVTVFTAPTPFRAGPVDISILVQDRATGALVPGARASICLTKAGQATVTLPATTEAATNKLFRAAQFDVPASGLWNLEVQIDGPSGSAAIQASLEAAKALPQWHELSWWISWPGVVVVLFAIHQVRVSRHRGRRARLARTRSAVTIA
jgi:hypothetical protein